MKRTLEMTVIEGIKTTIPLHLRVRRSGVRRRQAEHLVHGAFPRPPIVTPAAAARRGLCVPRSVGPVSADSSPLVVHDSESPVRHR
jgi:hypothetical protein